MTVDQDDRTQPRSRAPEPTRTLAPGARGYWAVEALGWAIPLVILSLVAARGLTEGAGAPAALGVLLPAAAALVGLVGVAVVPGLRWAHWRYDVRDEEIDLRSGAFTVTRTLIPMARVQHVDTKRTVISQLFGLAAVTIHTAAGRNVIPALNEPDAAAIRDRIAELARTPDEP
ncbi:MAG TPA: PH domain-containing protein [Solirubrobacteraceae bacterium]|nr:PH domain-containing protein [Solirubrobacteraceae bacterium]